MHSQVALSWKGLTSIPGNVLVARGTTSLASYQGMYSKFGLTGLPDGVLASAALMINHAVNFKTETPEEAFMTESNGGPWPDNPADLHCWQWSPLMGPQKLLVWAQSVYPTP